MRSQNSPSFSGLSVRQLMVSGFVTSPELQLRICLEDARLISMASKLLMSIMGVKLLSVAVVKLGCGGAAVCARPERPRERRAGEPAGDHVSSSEPSASARS